MADQVPDDVKRDRIERLVEVVQRVARGAQRRAHRPGRGGARRGTESRTDPSFLRGRTRRNTTVNFVGDAAAGELVDVLIDRATSTTLGGAQVAVAVRLVVGGRGAQRRMPIAAGRSGSHRLQTRYANTARHGGRERDAAPRERERQQRLDRTGAASGSVRRVSA